MSGKSGMQLKSKHNKQRELTACGKKVHACVQAKKKACRTRSRALLAQKMGMTPSDLSKLYPNFDVHHEKRMTFKQTPECSCSLSCPINQTSLVPSAWNRGVMKAYETNTQKGYAFHEQMTGTRKTNGTAPPLPPRSISVAHPKGVCRSRRFMEVVDARVEDRAFAQYLDTAKLHAPMQARSRSWFGAAIKEAVAVRHTIDELRNMQLKGAGLYRLLPHSKPKQSESVSRAPLQPIVVLRHPRVGFHLLDGKTRIRSAHNACPSRAKVAVLFVRG
jgi:hypothetical protein